MNQRRERDQEIADLYVNARWSAIAIGEKFDLPPSLVMEILRRMEVPVAKTRRKPVMTSCALCGEPVVKGRRALHIGDDYYCSIGCFPETLTTLDRSSPRSLRDPEIVRLYLDGKLAPEAIGAHFGISRIRVYAIIKAQGAETHDGSGRNRVECVCSTCGAPLVRNRSKAARLEHQFCDSECYSAWMVVQGEEGESSRRARRRLHPLPPGSSIHHVDGDNHRNDHPNLVVFRSRADHLLWHRGLREGVVPLWVGTSASRL